MNKKYQLFLIIPVLCLAVTFSCNNNKDNNGYNNSDSDHTMGSNSNSNMNSSSMMPSDELHTKAAELRTDMRKLWEDHVTWTRNVILNIMDGLPGTNEALKRLQQNQDDIGDAVASYYGKDAGKQLANLLHTHISQAGALLMAAKANNKDEFNKQDKMWHENADSIAHFLSSANPNWSYDDMKKMMDNHLQYTTDEAVARQKKNYDDDVKDYDKVHKEILGMADMLTEGIVKQYPDKFK